jgi:hypothetical protein
MTTTLPIDIWTDTFAWTPDTAESCVTELCSQLKSEHLSIWYSVAPRIGAGLTCLASHPDELYRLTLHIHKESGDSSRILLGNILAGVKAELPERLVLEALPNGGLMPILHNRNYTVTQRLSWLREHTEWIIPQGGIEAHAGDLESPIKNALVLWIFMEANKGQVIFFHWLKGGITEEFASSLKFIETHAPGIVDQIGMVQTLGLSYTEAFNMLIDVGAGKQVEAVLALPDLDDTQGPSRAPALQ